MGAAAREPLLERENELTALVDLLARAQDGEGRVLLLEGSAGIGKTRLLQAARQRAKDEQMRVLAARGTELERDFPFALVRQLFEPALHALEPSERDKLLADAARPAGPVVGVETGEPETGRAGAVADPSFATLNALYWLTSNLAESAPLLLAVDDVHWADKASLRFLRFLAPRLEDLPVLLAIAVRRPEPGTESDLLDQLVADPIADVVRPCALSRTAVAELVRSRLSSDADDDFCAASHEATAGNPYMLRELLVELSAEGSSGTAAEARHVRELAPATIQRSVLLRLARLPDDAGRLARAVAVLGDDADPRQAGALADLDPGKAGEAADALVAAGVLEPGRPLRFAHPLVRNAVYADLSDADKETAHRVAARLLEREGAEPERIALHLLATDPAGDPEVIATLSAAAERALDRAAPEATIAYARRALAEPPDAGPRRELLWHLVRASFRAGERGALEGLESEALDQLGEGPETLLSSFDELGAWLYSYGSGEQYDALLERARVAALQTGNFDLVMRFEAMGITTFRTAPTEVTPRWKRYADHIAPGTHAERIWLTLQALGGYALGEPAATVADRARRALGDGRIFHEMSPTNIHGVLVYLLLAVDELDVGEQAIEQLLAVSRSAGSAPAIAGALHLRAWLAIARGDIAHAEPDARASVEALRQGDWFRIWPQWLALLLDVLVERDELDAAEQELEASGLSGQIPDEFRFGVLLYSRGHLRLARGRTAEGLADLGELGKRAQRDGFKNIAAIPTAAVAAIALAGLREGKSTRGLVETYLELGRSWGALLAIALTGLGQGNPARAMADLHLRSARASGTPRRIGIGLHAMGVVRGGEKGIALLREAVATLEDSPARLEHAKALTDLGAALRRANRRAEAREPLRQALEIARRGGALAVAQRAHEELEATGERLGRFAPVGIHSLSPSERRIAALAAEGLTNRQIAQDLFLSIKTVESHLRGAYRKLDIKRRSELPAALRSGD